MDRPTVARVIKKCCECGPDCVRNGIHVEASAKSADKIENRGENEGMVAWVDFATFLK